MPELSTHSNRNPLIPTMSLKQSTISKMQSHPLNPTQTIRIETSVITYVVPWQKAHDAETHMNTSVGVHSEASFGVDCLNRMLRLQMQGNDMDLLTGVPGGIIYGSSQKSTASKTLSTSRGYYTISHSAQFSM